MIEIKSNNWEGDQILFGMRQTEKEWANQRDIFSEFIEQDGFTAWHIHNGWVRHEYETGSGVVEYNEINICWIREQAGYNHVWRCPEIGERMVVIKNSPTDSHLKPFVMHCYEVIEKGEYFKDPKIKLKKIGIKHAIFNGTNYEYREPKKDTFEKFRGIINYFLPLILAVLFVLLLIVLGAFSS